MLCCSCTMHIWQVEAHACIMGSPVGSVLPGCSFNNDVRAFAGCIERASCLLLYLDMVRHDLIQDGRFRVPWRTVCKIVPMQSVRSLVDQWILSSGSRPSPVCAALWALPMSTDFHHQAAFSIKGMAWRGLCFVQRAPSLAHRLPPRPLRAWCWRCA